MSRQAPREMTWNRSAAALRRRIDWLNKKIAEKSGEAVWMLIYERDATLLAVSVLEEKIIDYENNKNLKPINGTEKV